MVPYQVIKLVKELNRKYSAILNLVSFRETNTEVHEENAVKNTCQQSSGLFLQAVLKPLASINGGRTHKTG